MKHPIRQSPYSASKIAADQISLSYSKSFKLPIKILRPFNTFGPVNQPEPLYQQFSPSLGSKTINVGNTHN